MSFTSLTFPVFLALVLLIYCVLTPRLRLPFLVSASYVFYGWNHVIFLPLLFASTCIHYVGGRIIGSSESPSRRRVVATLCILTDLSLLAVFKYSVVFFGLGIQVASVLGATVSHRGPHFVLPTAISFYTLQSIGYTVDVYRRKVQAEKSFQRFALYVAFFPQLVAGPIERAHQMLPQFGILRRPSAIEVRDGVTLIVWGMFKKLVVADRLATFCDPILANPSAYSPSQVLLAPYVFMYRLYCDLGGYTDIAVGTGILFGLKMMSNFDRPFGAVSIRGMWQRWHISLTRWMMEFVFLPLAMAFPGRAGRAFATIAVFVLIGVWHGPSWNYLAFGFVMGSIIVVGDLRRRFLPPPSFLCLPIRWRKFWSQPACWTLMAAATAVFAPPDLWSSWLVFARGAATFTGAPGLGSLLAGPPLSPYEWVILGACVTVVEAAERLRRQGTFSAAMDAAALPVRWAAAYAVAFATLIFGEFSPLPFYYFRF